MKLSENVEMLEIKAFNQTIHPVILWDKDSMVLIDAGFPQTFDLFKEEMQKLGLKIENISHIILTHQDIDHIGFVKEIMELNPNVKILAHEVEAPYIDGRKTPVKLAALEANSENLDEQRKGFLKMLTTGFAARKIPITHELKDGEVIDVCGGIEIVFTPGHTPGHICIYLRKSKIAVCGDALNIANDKFVGPNPQQASDAKEANESIGKLNGFGIETLVAYHSGACNKNVKEKLNDLCTELIKE
ncbi:MBL fold metallo-hydrolase [Clostridium fungisolvens]|uniref:Putative metallo-hydrolase YflN n=1 Tax=Clostridium fungisolvens TaxID=1604897 RepID=A0A6V8SGC6_9CLOT|nr:MBL fold metallo-hydrolase [Clostridium fungisolvens]GFP75525.1 putative metallo-hydrolase YflN [Clostridium fungisolvens]